MAALHYLAFYVALHLMLVVLETWYASFYFELVTGAIWWMKYVKRFHMVSVVWISLIGTCIIIISWLTTDKVSMQMMLIAESFFFAHEHSKQQITKVWFKIVCVCFYAPGSI